MVHNNMANTSLEIGAIVNKVLFVNVGLDCSFRNSLIASAKG